jgi:hypothetical protein
MKQNNEIIKYRILLSEGNFGTSQNLNRYNKKLSDAGYRMLDCILNNRDGWVLNFISNFEKDFGWSKSKTLRTKKELENLGYIKTTKKKTKGRWHYKYELFELPSCKNNDSKMTPSISEELTEELPF